ncbi:MAG: phosphoribosyltransferase [Acidobacteriaceae bacterium]|jgi:predicted phosphoribosyltransferase
MLFEDRFDAGQRLAQRLQEFANRDDVLVLALPRGGVPVGFAVSRALRAPLDIFVVRKLGVPGYEEFAMGAIASGGFHILNPDVVNGLNVSPEQVDSVLNRELRELERRQRAYRDDRLPLDVHGKTLILVDDGLATGSTMRAAILALRQQNPSRLVVAVPVSAVSPCRDLEKEADAVVCLYTPFNFHAVGQWYRNFSQTTDAEVHDLLNRSATPAA